MPANVFVLGLDEQNLETLRSTAALARCRFHTLLGRDELQPDSAEGLADLITKAEAQLEAHLASGESLDAIVGYWDFPVSSLVPILCERYGLRSAPLDAVVKCEHKYWSRLEQQKTIDAYPRFALVGLDDLTGPPDALDYPFWLKPVKSAASQLAFRVEDRHQLADAVAALRAGVPRLGEPFEYVLDQVDLPPQVAAVGAKAALAEAAADGVQITVEGYRHDGQVHVYGIIDSVRYPNSPSFLRYQYPTSLPQRVIDHVSDVTARVVTQIGLNSVPFNIEFFWDPETDAFWLLEINPRHSQSHAKLFELVDGAPNHHCVVMLALGHDPGLPHRRGRYAVAAKWFLRRFTDGVVVRTPTPAEVARAEREVPGTTVTIGVREGDRLSELARQDSYSYQLAAVHIGARDEAELRTKYTRCLAALPFEFQTPDGGTTVGDGDAASSATS